MPILWRYFLSQYLKVLILSTLSFILILLTTRLDDIAHFATLGPEGLLILKFALYQIPYILPIALPISCLISAILLYQRLSSSHEITAMRAAGFGIGELILPVVLASLLLSLGNFYIVSETATISHLQSGLLKSELRSINPLLLLNNKHLLKMKGLYFDVLGQSKLGDYATETLFAMRNKSTDRISLMISKNMQVSSQDFVLNDMTIISNLEPSKDEINPGATFIENISKSITAISDFSQILQKKVWKVNNDHLKMSWLLIRIADEQRLYQSAKEQDKPSDEIKQLKRNLNRSLSEIVRRVSSGVAVFTFTLMGIAFGISISRQQSKKGFIFVVFMVAFYLACYFAGKAVEYQFVLSSVLFILPHILMLLGSFWTLNRLSKGIE